MEWIAGNYPLSQEQMENNATLLWQFFQTRGWSLNAVCGMLGNIQAESTINPGRWQEGIVEPQQGYGLVQWTPSTNVTDWLTANDYPIDSGNGQCERIVYEKDNNLQWIPTSSYPYSFTSFSTSTDSPYDLAMAFLANYERPAEPNQPARGMLAEIWFEYLTGKTFVPRLTKEGMKGSKYWYSDTNPFYPSGYGLPNCTCYAWGRFWEIGDWNGQGEHVPTLPTGNGDTWWGNVQGYEKGQTPLLGAVACYYRIGGGAGHVAIVEEINGTEITMSNSNYYRGAEGTEEWNRNYFFLSRADGKNNFNWDPNLSFQGFIYNPYALNPSPPLPSPSTKVRWMSWLKPHYKKCFT